MLFRKKFAYPNRRKLLKLKRKPKSAIMQRWWLLQSAECFNCLDMPLEDMKKYAQSKDISPQCYQCVLAFIQTKKKELDLAIISAEKMQQKMLR